MSDEKGPVLEATVPGAVRRYWWLALGIVAACAGLGVAYSLLVPATATATASLVVEDPRASSILGNNAPSDSYVLDQAVILQLPVTVDLVRRDLRQAGLAQLTTREFIKALSVETDGESNLLRITFSHRDPDVPAVAVNSLIERYREVLTYQSQRSTREQIAVIDRTLSQLDDEIDRLGPGDPAAADLVRTRADLVQQRARLELGQGVGTNGIKVVSPATESRLDEPLDPLPAAALGGLVGTVPAAAAAYLLAQRRRRFGHRYQPEIVLSRPLLSEVPDFSAERLKSDLPALDEPDSTGAESFRFLSSALALQQRSAQLCTVAVVSAASRDGKTTVAANLAVSAAQDGQRVLAVDADLAGQGLGFLLLGEDRSGPGLVQVLEGSARLDAVIRRTVAGTGGLDVLTGGSDARFATELFGSSSAEELFRSLRASYDLVVVDVPPVLQVAYTASLLSKMDAAVLVVPHGASVASVEELAERISFIDTPVAGYVYNKAPLRREVGRHSRLVNDARRRPPPASEREVARIGATRGSRPATPGSEAPGA